MASEDVIELGSSDDEGEPAPKKSKPMPNAMVCIPRKLHEVTIKPAKLNIDRPEKGLGKAVQSTRGIPTAKGVSTAKGLSITRAIHIAKGLPRGALTTREGTVVKALPVAKKQTTVTKVPSILSNPFASKYKTNGKPLQKMVVNTHLKLINKPIKIQKPSTSRPIVTFPKVSDSPNMSNVTSTLLKNSIKLQNKKSLTNLPPSITVKKTTQSSHKPIIFMKSANLAKHQLNSEQGNEVHTVELDDDEGSATSSSPAWYLRPEEQSVAPTLEQENNTEPESPAMIEITIEDSPIKPALNKRTCEIGAELAITIDDSPVKASADKNASHSGSDEETTSTKVPHNKKKLEYPKEAGNENRKIVEIEIDIPYEASDTNSITKNKIDVYEEVKIVNVDPTPEPNKKNDGAERITQNTNSTVSKENKIEIPSSSAQSEFHSVYQSFIDVCFQLENSEDMKKIVEKKIKAYYRQVPKAYTESEEFIDMVASKILAMKASPEKMYLYIKDIVDELNMQRKIAQSQIVNMETKIGEPDKFSFGEESEYDSKRQRQIRKLEKTIKKLHRAIQKLEEQEVDFDDEDDSVYLLTERYKERMVRVYAKFCQLTNTKMPSEPRITIEARLGQPAGPARRLEKWINKKVPIGTPLPFPDFHDVLRCVRDANDEDKLCWNEVDIMEEARDLFTRCGKKLQRRRQENEWRLAASRIALEVDPAENNEQLKFKLEENRKLASKKETEIFNKYADRQNQLKLEAVEIGDKEAEESPVESEEEEANDESVSLENKGKRKEILKRLIQEISKGPSEAKENQPSKEPKVEADVKLLAVIEETDVIENKEDSDTILEKCQNNDKDKSQSDKDSHNVTETLSVSDESNDLESDIDELHLLQKLHPGNEVQTSTSESSDSDSPIAISDSLESGSDTKKQQSDVISIENSSYSESETDKVDSIPLKNTDSVELIILDRQPNNETETLVVGIETGCSNDVIKRSPPNDIIETECSNTDTKKINSKSNNNEYSESVEDILLASSDEENGGSQEEGPSSADGACINLRDDLISIDETVVGSVVDEPEKDVEKQPGVIILEKESNADEPSIAEKNVNDLKNDNKVTAKLNNVESISTSQNKTPSTAKEESAQNVVSVVSDDTKTADTVTNMDVDPADEELETDSRVDEHLLSALSLETQ